ncbi:transcription-repair coupling factor [Lactobacillus sp. UCMA15818]|uniref:transcription-repair coupling factor n=1 Tax=Lactobacillus sp. UCMA15818 TaxID=2583394 RepID=UPI0025B0E7EC|nr:transcription-repair coupling factor [Lactobacillus sp. UCMA15818]MDN2453875.1 transcription-repair coupling factor [Lactobacillus sp. UCMA15818]
MKLQEIFTEIPELDIFLKNLDEGKGQRNLLTGLIASAKPLFLAELLKKRGENILFVTDSLHHAQQLERELLGYVDKEQVFLFAVDEAMAAEVAISSPEYRSERIKALTALQEHELPKIVITSTRGLKSIVPLPSVWKNAKVNLTIGNDIEQRRLIDNLAELGYQRTKLIEKIGDFAVRGSIVDVFPANIVNPIRIDLFDTEIDSLREFDMNTQRSIENIKHVEILPATDVLISKEQIKKATENISTALNGEKKILKNKDSYSKLSETIEDLLKRIKERKLLSSDAAFLDKITNGKTNITDYLAEDDLLIMDDYPRLLDTEKILEDDDANWKLSQVEMGKIFSDEYLGESIRKIVKKIKQKSLFLSIFEKGMGQLLFNQKLDLKVRGMQNFFGQMPLLKTEIDRWSSQKQTVVISISDKERLDKIAATLENFEIRALIVSDGKIKSGQTQLILANLATGFELPQEHLVVITENELFNKLPKRRVSKRQTMENSERLKSYTELKEGDYVVHINHGIGKYIGMRTMEVEKKHQDYLTIVYRDDAKLFLPVTQIDRIQKYVSGESKAPHINKLGGSEWKKTKSSVASKIEDIADELVELYAKREMEQGFAFSADNEYQKEFEDGFSYSETPDQLRSSAEIKRDMERKVPMDRLLIGDVGYGKTEVALRAAFKAIQDQKQVAFLAPTTVLAQQHYETMVNRFGDFPVQSAVLSRFQTRKQVKQTISDLKHGVIDIVVGTHRLLSNDIKFADLGLLIIDEEQRFGVKHKEKLKQLRSQVDVLTLTATPIPRTLNMSMLGVRDLSVIETAPMNRYPIQTYVMEQNYGTVADAISREMARGGQTFYLHNRVADIEKTVAEIKAFVPEAQVAYIHGQMTELQLERILVDFIAGEYDVLVTTTIIETGVDIPNVNTLIVENADKMGLSQLYQLRGRVGRSNRVAYAYFMYQENKVLTEISEKRLEAIKNFTELGSGFKIAMRDLSIRGAGNLLGKQQHGFIDSVGYDLYTQMLKEAVARKRGVGEIKKTDAELKIGIEAYLPSSYVEDQRQKIELYKRIRQIENEEQFFEIQEDLLDRFGEYPSEVDNLLQLGLLKMYADMALVEVIDYEKKKINVIFSEDAFEFYSAEDYLEIIAKINLKAILKSEQKRMKISIALQPASKFAKNIADMTEMFKKLSKKIKKVKEHEKQNS